MKRGKAHAPLAVHVLVLEECTPLVPVGVADMLRKTSALAEQNGWRGRPIDVRLVSASHKRDVQAAGGVRIGCATTASNVERSDLVVVPAVDPDIDHHLALNRRAIPWVRRMFDGGADVASACTGAFLLGEAGVLDRRSATTHWAFQPAFAQRYPKVRLLPQAILVDQGRVITAGGATSFLNLALHLAERIFGADVARAASKMFLVDVNKAPQSAYAMFASQKLHDDEGVLRAQSLIERKPMSASSVEDVARAVAMSARTFARRFRTATGNSPSEYIRRVKVEAAKRVLETGERVSAAAAAAGYGDAHAFRKAFMREAGLSPAEYRARYGPRSRPSTVLGR